MGNKRMEYLDYVKGFGILLVVLGHVYAGNNYIKIWLYSFILTEYVEVIFIYRLLSYKFIFPFEN